jgi:hypothetical protein
MVVNETINATIEAGLLETIRQNAVVDRFIELIGAPILHKEMLWITLPLIISLFLMQLYFGRYRKEELGWNTAVGNSLALIFVSMDLFRHIYTNAASKAVLDIVFNSFREVAVVLVLGLISMWLLFGEFFHLLPKRLAFYVSSSLPTTLLAYLAIVLIYTNVPLDSATLLAGLLLFIVLVILFRIIRIFEPFYLSEGEKGKLFKR